jgi:hypothetical protein
VTHVRWTAKLSHPREKLRRMANERLRTSAEAREALYEFAAVNDGVFTVPNAAASFRAGSALFDLPRGDRNLAEITSPRWLRSRKLGLIVHESTLIDPIDIRLVDGIPAMRAERLLIEMASIYISPNFIETFLHAILRKRVGTIASTIATFNRLATRGRPGIRVVREVLARWDPALEVTDSNPETTLLQILREANLGRIATQYVIRDANGNFVARVDVGMPDVRVAIEYDSDQEHTDEISLARDNARRLAIIAAGWFPISARKAELRTGTAALLAAIRTAANKPA